jgi:hypothetical protein
MLEARLAYSTLAVKQEAVVVQGLQNSVEKMLSAKEEPCIKNGRAGHVGIETPAAQSPLPTRSLGDHAAENQDQKTCHQSREPWRANEGPLVDDQILAARRKPTGIAGHQPKPVETHGQAPRDLKLGD